MTRRDAWQPLRGFTLLELLASLAILGLFIAMATPWLTTTSRALQAASRQSEESVALSRVIDAIVADLDAGVAGSLRVGDEPGDSFSVRTARAIGTAAPGWRSVTWSFNSEHSALQRIESSAGGGQRVRTALWGVASFVAEASATDKPSEVDGVLVQLETASGLAQAIDWRPAS